MSNTPSREDIDLLVRAYLGDCGPQANYVYSFVTAVLAQWGTPQPVVRGPMPRRTLLDITQCYSDRETFGRAVEAWHGIKGGQT